MNTPCFSPAVFYRGIEYQKHGSAHLHGMMNKYNHLPMGLKCSPNVARQSMAVFSQGNQGLAVYVDDISITANDQIYRKIVWKELMIKIINRNDQTYVETKVASQEAAKITGNPHHDNATAHPPHPITPHPPQSHGPPNQITPPPPSRPPLAIGSIATSSASILGPFLGEVRLSSTIRHRL